jgi:hypothetical protein
MPPSFLSLGTGGPVPFFPRRRHCGGPRAAIEDPQGAAVVQMSSAATMEGLRLAEGGRAMQERGGAGRPSSTATSSMTDRMEPHSATYAAASRPTERRCSSVHRRTPQGAARCLPDRRRSTSKPAPLQFFALSVSRAAPSHMQY